MARALFAVLVAHTATVASIEAHLSAPMRPLLSAHTVDHYRFGGECTGAWDVGYHPTGDPRNWRSCSTCGASTRLGADQCTTCTVAETAGRGPRAIAATDGGEWASHPGDIVALPRLLDPGWRYPHGRTPNAWVDHAGIVWLDTTDVTLTGSDSGQTPPRLRQVFDDLRANGRICKPSHPSAWFDPARWAVAVVDAYH